MDYTALHIACSDAELGEILTAELADLPFESFENGAGELVAYLPTDLLPACRGEADEALRRYGVTGRYEAIDTRNWNAEWEQNDFTPVQVGDRLLIRAPYHEAAPAGVMEVIVTPHMSFGTGHHATTRLMVQALLDLPLAGRRGLDLGSGTGVLAIVAAKCGARQVDAVDIDDWAEASCRENARMNGVADRITALCGDVSLVAGRPYDFILANINRNILLDAFPHCLPGLTAGGDLLLSGFLEEDVPQLLAAAAPFGLHPLAVRAESEWRMIHLRKG